MASASTRIASRATHGGAELKLLKLSSKPHSNPFEIKAVCSKVQVLHDVPVSMLRWYSIDRPGVQKDL